MLDYKLLSIKNNEFFIILYIFNFHNGENCIGIITRGSYEKDYLF